MGINNLNGKTMNRAVTKPREEKSGGNDKKYQSDRI